MHQRDGADRGILSGLSFMIAIKKSGKIWLPIIFLLVIIGVSLFIPFKEALVFEHQNQGKIMAYLGIKIKDRFTIRYTHSVHLTPVIEDYYVNEKNEIVQTKETYERFGIGMPNNAIGDEIFTHKGNKYIISNMHRVFPYIDLRVGQVVANHTLIFKGKSYRIADFTGEGTWVRMKVRKINLWEMMKGVNIIGR
jgi:hypothetical protein